MPEQTATYGPFVGMMSSVDRDVIPADRVSGDSYNMIPDPLTGTMYTRPGSQTLMENNVASPAGLGENKFSARCRQILEVQSPKPADAYPLVASIWTNEATNEGAIYFKDTDVGSTYTGGSAHTGVVALGADMGTTHYPRASTTAEFVMPVQKTRHSPTTGTERRDYTRAVDAIQRKLMAPGTRRATQMNDELFLPNYSGTPSRWTKDFNPNGSGSRINRIRPWGNYPPVGQLVFTEGGGGTSCWTAGQKAYYSVMYEFNDGSFSMPMIPRPINARLGSGYQLFTAAGSDYLTISNIPIGPYGTRRRWILRSPSPATAGTPDPQDLRVAGYIDDNVSTTYVDTLGDKQENATGASGLTADTTRIRFDHVWPWRARYSVGGIDERVFIGYLRPNPAALMVCPYKNGGAVVIPIADDGNQGSNIYSYAVRDDQTSGASIRYFVTNDTGATLPKATEVTWSLSTYTYLQDLCDAINSDAGGGAYTAWRAAIIPGAGGSVPTSKLDITQVKIDATTGNNSTTLTRSGAELFTNVQVGMIIRDTDGHITSGTRVTAVAGNFQTLTMSAASSAVAGTTSICYIGWDVGDVISTAANVVPGDFRAWSAANPGIAYFSEAYLDTLANDKWKRTLMFTSSEPGGPRQCPNYFLNFNKLTLPASGGIYMGAAPIAGDTYILGVAFGSKQCYAIVNPRGGNTALDQDIRLKPITGSRGCIAHTSITHGDGWVGFLCEDGYAVTDGRTIQILTRDVWNVGASEVGTGDLLYEISQCRRAAVQDDESKASAQFHALASQGSLFINYRSSASFSYPNRQLTMDYSPGLAGNGLAEITKGPNETYGWSAPTIWKTGQYHGCMAALTFDLGSSTPGLYYVSADDSEPGASGSGLLRQFNYTSVYTDDGTAYYSRIFTKTDRCGTMLKKRANEVRLLVKKDSGSTVTYLSRDKARTSSTAVVTLSAAATSPPQRYRRFVPVTKRSLSDVFELQIINDAGISSTIYQAELDFEIYDTPL